MKTYVFDIETQALAESELPPFDETQVAIGNLRDPDKIRAKLDSARADYIANAALDPMTARVAMVGVKEIGHDPMLIASLSETELVGATLTKLSEDIAAGHEYAGFACYNFDLPFLARRAWKLGMKLPINLRQGRYWAREITDLREEWLMGDRSPAKGTTSLDAIAKFLGLPPKLGSGKDFSGLDLEQRKAYLTRDLEITEALWLRMH